MNVLTEEMLAVERSIDHKTQQILVIEGGESVWWKMSQQLQKTEPRKQQQ